MHLNKGELPSVDGFRSLTMHDANYFFVSNPINRYIVSQRNKLKANADADGSVDRCIQKEPAPKDNFILMMRLRIRVSITRA